LNYTLAQRSDTHLARRIWHFIGVFTMFLIGWRLPTQALRIALIVTGSLVTLDLMRLRFQWLNRRLIWIFRPVLRAAETERPTGSTYMLLGVTLIAYVFPRPVVLLTLLFFSMADPAAAYFGTLYGKDKLIGPKSLQGSTAAFLVCFVLTLAYCLLFHMMTERLVIVAVIGGLIGAVSELVPVAGLDDNFVFPVLSAALLTPVFILFGGL
jgi:diacylglycerol kinase (CTP)